MPLGTRALITTLTLGLACMALAACSSRNPFSPPTLEPLEVQIDGRWMRDRSGRVVLLRGVTFSSFEAERWFGSRGGPGEEELAELESLGVNVLRIPLTWALFEPTPGLLDFTRMVENLDPLIRSAASRGMLVILSMRQVHWSECFAGGAGAPAWVCAGRDYPDDAQGWARAECDFWRGEPSPRERPLRDHFIDVWVTLAAHYAHDSRVVGFDLVDEPSGEGCGPPDQFQSLLLDPFLHTIEARIREVGATQAIFYEPPVSREAALPARVSPRSAPAVYAPHLFSQTFGPPSGGTPDGLSALYDMAERQAAEIGGPLFLGEFGGDGSLLGDRRQTSVGFLRESLAHMDRLRVGGTFASFVASTRQVTIVGPGVDGYPVSRDVLARPYARRIAGIPLAMRFDPATREFSLRFGDDPERRLPDPSEIFLASRHVYRDGFEVELSDGSWRYDEHTQRLLVYRGSSSEHEVRVRPSSRPPD